MFWPVRLAVGLLLALAAILFVQTVQGAPFAPGSTILVNSTFDDGSQDADLGDSICADGSGNCTLSAALSLANKAGAHNLTIRFDPELFGADVERERRTIYLAVDLPTLANPDITLDASDLGANVRIYGYEGCNVAGFRLAADRIILRNLSFISMPVGGIEVVSGQGIRLENISIYDGTKFGNGAGLFVSSSQVLDLVVQGARIWNNTANGGNSGGGVFDDGVRSTYRDSRIYNNTANADGGGLRLVGTGTLLENVTVMGNQAPRSGGIHIQGTSVSIANSTIALNNATASDGKGGGLAAFGGRIVLANTTLRGNVAGQDGGGAFADFDAQGDDLQIIDSVFQENVANRGSALYANRGWMNVTRSVVEGNDARGPNGWAAVATNLDFLMANSRISNNTGGGISGGGAFVNTTVFDNPSGGLAAIVRAALTDPPYATWSAADPFNFLSGQPSAPIGSFVNGTLYRGNVSGDDGQVLRIEVYRSTRCPEQIFDREMRQFLGFAQVTLPADGTDDPVEIEVALTGVPYGSFNAVATRTNLEDGFMRTTTNPGPCVAGENPDPFEVSAQGVFVEGQFNRSFRADAVLQRIIVEGSAGMVNVTTQPLTAAEQAALPPFPSGMSAGGLVLDFNVTVEGGDGAPLRGSATIRLADADAANLPRDRLVVLHLRDGTWQHIAVTILQDDASGLYLQFSLPTSFSPFALAVLPPSSPSPAPGGGGGGGGGPRLPAVAVAPTPVAPSPSPPQPPNPEFQATPPPMPEPGPAPAWGSKSILDTPWFAAVAWGFASLFLVLCLLGGIWVVRGRLGR